MADDASQPQPQEPDGFIRSIYAPDQPLPAASDVDLKTFNIADPEFWRRDAHWDYFARLRKEAPVHYCPDSPFGPYWSVTRYKDVMTVDTSHGEYSSEGGITIVDPPEDFQLPMFIAMDPPKHDLQRKTVQSIVGPENLKNFETLIRSRTQNLLDTLPRGEAFDWVNTVSIELTTMMLATLFDFPFEERRRLTRWSDVATGRGNPEIVPGGEDQWRGELMECLFFFTGLWNERVNTDPRSDLISMLAHGEHTRNMTPQEYLGNLLLLIVGGNDTTRNSMTGGVYAFNKWPNQFRRMKENPELIPSAVSEIIRWQTPLAHMRRTTLTDVELAGVKIPKGSKVLMWYVSGNRDETAFENPNELWIERPKVRSHLAFGFGIHRCVGNRLAELQLRILWEEILKRFEWVEVLEEPTRLPSAFVKGYTRMMVRLH